MPRRTNNNKAKVPVGRRPRQLRVVSDLRPEPNIDQIAKAIFTWAVTAAEAELAQNRSDPKPDPFVCNCMCNCCELRRIHDGLCPQPSDEQLDEARMHAA